ncbi:hypothetical protein ACHIPZ_00635 [Antrihabitans sp. NCIMB 15449]|uniref:Uncharacterized protein n=1 Tax=Antrihabitans spumae TaxID=3373370 RepID=A0ABW7JFJ4_9NOCA
MRRHRPTATRSPAWTSSVWTNRRMQTRCSSV